MASNTAQDTADNTQSALIDAPVKDVRILPMENDDMSKSPPQSQNGSIRSHSSSSSSYQTSKLSGSARSYSSTIRHSQEPHETFGPRVEKLCQILWPPQRSLKYRFSNSQAISRLRANKFLRAFVLSRQTPLIERLRGGDYNRVVGITLPSTYAVDHRQLILRVLRREDGTSPDRAAAILEYVRKYTSIPIPTIVAKDFGNENPLEKPYVIQTRISGSDLDRIWDELNHQQRCTVARDLGSVVRTLLSLEAPVTGILEAGPETGDTSGFSNIVPFELQQWGPEGLVVPTSVDTISPRTRQTTLDFFQTQLGLWRADAVAEHSDVSVELFDRMLKATREMADLGLFGQYLNCLCHVDIHMGNVMAKIQPDNSLKVTAVLDWDEAVFAPKFFACEPLGWIWGYIASDHVDEDEHLIWPYELAGANDLPSTPEQQELKWIFDEQAGPEYRHLAYDEISRLCRGLSRIAIEGLAASHYYKAANRILKEWEVLRQTLTQRTPVIPGENRSEQSKTE